MMRYQIILCWSLLLITDPVYGIVGTQNCPDNAITFLERNCIYNKAVGNWSTAFKASLKRGATRTVVDLRKNETLIELMYKLLLKEKLTSIWLEVKQFVSDGHRIYLLPNSDRLGRTLQVELDRNSSLFSNGIKWTKTKPDPNATCVLLTAFKENKGLRLQMEDCSKVHTFLTITDKKNDIDESFLYKDQDQRVDTTLEEIPLPSGFTNTDVPELHIRQSPMHGLFLEVYNPQGLWNFSVLDSNTVVHHPFCILEGTELGVHTLPKMEYADNKNGSDIYKIISEPDGYVTCYAFTSATLDIISTDRFLKQSELDEPAYSLAVRYNASLCKAVSCNPSLNADFLSGPGMFKEMFDTTGKRYTFKPVLITEETEDTVNIVFRVEGVSDVMQLNGTIYDYIRRFPSHILAVLSIHRFEFCEAQDMALADGSVLRWPATELGKTVLPNGTCQQVNRTTAITRTCHGDSVTGAYWGSVNLNLTTCTETSRRARQIFNLSQNSKSNSKDKLKELDRELAPTSANNRSLYEGPLTIAEIYNIADIFAKLQPHELTATDIPVIANITNTILTSSSIDEKDQLFSSLRTAQEKTNSSNSILQSLDRLLNDINIGKQKEFVVKNHFVTFTLDISLSDWNSPSGFRGLAVMNTSHFHTENINQLTRNDSVDSISEMKVSTAVLLPDSLLNIHQSTNATQRLVINLFWDASLFGTNTSVVPHHVVSVTLDGKRQNLTEKPVFLFFAQQHTEVSHSKEIIDPCVFWDFHRNKRQGAWSSDGCTSSNMSSSAVDICVCTHLTHFGKLLYNTGLYPVKPEELTQDVQLTYITIIGCCLSIVGLVGIFLTAVIFPEWRRGTGKKIQLNLSTASFLLMLSFLVHAIIGEGNMDHVHCIFTGVLLHFSLLALHLWMLATAWYQYRRLTHPLESLDHIPHYLLVTSAIAWGMPAVLCTVLLSVDINIYGPPTCYLQDGILLYTVFIPLGLIYAVNAIIFILIVWSIFGCWRCMVQITADCQLRNNQAEKRRIIQRVISSLYLSSLLGLCWVFGFLQWEYPFCITSTLQGLSFFIFFVIMDPATRARWHRFAERHQLNSNIGFSINSSDIMKRLTWIPRRKSRPSVRVSMYIEPN